MTEYNLEIPQVLVPFVKHGGLEAEFLEISKEFADKLSDLLIQSCMSVTTINPIDIIAGEQIILKIDLK